MMITRFKRATVYKRKLEGGGKGGGEMAAAVWPRLVAAAVIITVSGVNKSL